MSRNSMVVIRDKEGNRIEPHMRVYHQILYAFLIGDVDLVMYSTM